MSSRKGFVIGEPDKVAEKSYSNVFALYCFSAFTIFMSGEVESHDILSDFGSNTFCLSTETNVISSADLLDYDYNNIMISKMSMTERLKNLYEDLNENWDGHSALPMEKSSYENTLNAIQCMSGKVLSKMNLFPCPNGTFLLTTKDNMASINIGNNDFTYVAYRNAENQVKGRSSYDSVRFSKVVDTIINVLEYDA